jgi:KDO2-lipid IV(A) lauroyltransferase
MDALLYILTRVFLVVLRLLPLPVVALWGRAMGWLAYACDGRHRRIAHANLTRCFGNELSPAAVRALARENYQRIVETYFCALRTLDMGADRLRRHCDLAGVEELQKHHAPDRRRNVIVAIGHFGNFDLYAHFGQFAPGFQCVTTHRSFRPKAVNDLIQSLRLKTGCRYFERRTESAALRNCMHEQGVLLGLFADQNAGRGGSILPFLGQPCSTSTAPAVFALRYECPLYTAICYRTGLARWRLELGDEIPTRNGAEKRSVEDIMLDVNRAFEAAVRRDPANWFWVHNRWKTFS